MNIIRDEENYRLLIKNDDNKTVLLFSWLGADAYINLNLCEPVVINEEVDSYLYHNLDQLFSNDYQFDDTKLSYKYVFYV